jgi:crossover junction endodeoxyribonuclease RuvC
MSTQMQNRETRVLAIDPGIERLGIAILDKDGSKEKLLYSECFKTKKSLSQGDRLLEVGNRVREVIEKWRPECLAIETLFFNVNISSALSVAEARGVVVYVAKENNMEICEYSPQAVKIAVTGFGAADKKQVESMTRRLVKVGERKMIDDELDAIALGITHLASRKSI